jgi:hypothetical protein
MIDDRSEGDATQGATVPEGNKIADRAIELADQNLDPRTAAGELYETAGGDRAALEDALRSVQDRLGAEPNAPLQRALHYLTAAVSMANPIEP